MKLSREHQKKVKGGYTQWRSFAEGFTARLLENMYRDIHNQESSRSGEIDFDRESNEFSLTVQTAQLEAIKRYKTVISEKIREFLNSMGCNGTEKLHTSKSMDFRSFKQGRLAANGYNVTKTSLNNKQLI